MTTIVESPDTFILCATRDDAEHQKSLLEPEEQLATLLIDLD